MNIIYYWKRDVSSAKGLQFEERSLDKSFLCKEEIIIVLK